MTEIKSIKDIEQVRLFGGSNFNNIISQSLQVLNDIPALVSERNMDIGDTPISPMMIEDDYTPIFFSPEVIEEYKRLVEIINVPETSKEYSFVLLGKFGSFGGEKCYIVEKLIDCSKEDSDLSNRMTKTDENKLNETIRFALQNGYNFISLGHTHPNIPEEERLTTIASYLPEEVKNSEYIRDAGLNLSLQDFISYESLYQFFANNRNIRTCLSVIMYNGEIAMVSKENSSLNRFVILMDGSTGKEIYVSSKEEFDEKKVIK